MKTPSRLSAILVIVALLAPIPGIAGAQNKTVISYNAGVDPANLVVDGKKMTKSAFEAGLAREIDKFLRAGGGKDKGLDLTSVNVIKDCTASVTCGNGTKIECSIKGPGTCESGMVSVVCIAGNSSTVQTC